MCLMMALTLLPLQAFAADADTAPAGVLAEFSKEGLAELSTGTMKVYVDEAFPRVVRYVLNPGTDKETAVDGQPDALDVVMLNGVAVKPVVTSSKAPTARPSPTP